MNKHGQTENAANKGELDSVYKLEDLEKRFKAGEPINDWKVLVRVVDKRLSTYENQRGSGIRLNVKIIDRKNKYYLRRSGESEIYECVCFNQDADYFNQIIEVEKAYYISNAVLKEGLFTKKIELHLSKRSTIVKECLSIGVANSLPHLDFDFVKISGFNSFSVGSTVDIIGVITQVT